MSKRGIAASMKPSSIRGEAPGRARQIVLELFLSFLIFGILFIAFSGMVPNEGLQVPKFGSPGRYIHLKPEEILGFGVGCGLPLIIVAFLLLATRSIAVARSVRLPTSPEGAPWPATLSPRTAAFTGPTPGL